MYGRGGTPPRWRGADQGSTIAIALTITEPAGEGSACGTSLTQRVARPPREPAMWTSPLAAMAIAPALASVVVRCTNSEFCTGPGFLDKRAA